MSELYPRRCPTCKGSGYQGAYNAPDTPSMQRTIGAWPCPDCKGSGVYDDWVELALKQMFNKEQKKMAPEKNKVILDYATELQSNDAPWRKFEYKVIDAEWTNCSPSCTPLTHSYHGNIEFRRKRRTITVTIPVPREVTVSGVSSVIYLQYEDAINHDTALAAFQQEMKDE